YDPSSQAGSGRLELLQWLSSLGFDMDDLIDADRRLALGSLAGDRRLVPGERRGRAAAVARSGLSADRFDALSVAFGFNAIHGAPAGEIGHTDAEIDALSAIAALGETFSDEEAEAFARVVGAALARLGEAAVSLFLADIEGPHLLAGADEHALAQKVFDGVALLDGFTARLDPLYRRQVLQAIERTREAVIGETERLQYRFAVGFVDLVGFTPLSAEMPARELADFLIEFEARANELAIEHRARVVKLIGDEVMFVATDAANACAAGRALIEGFGIDGVLPRGGLAYGDVLLRAGDYFGNVVNLASRLVDEAVPGELLATEALADAAGPDRFEPAGRRQVKGFAAPVTVRSLRMT
ncbi:MAG: adenylate/guanylate cyclase domain-containing protein, partial [Actinomycetota bacterium]